MFRISFTIIEERPADVSIRAWAKAKRDAHTEQGIYWQTHYSKRHFTQRAAARYGYRRRSRRWLRKKAAMARRGAIEGNDRTDLVFTGGLRRASSVAAIRGFPSRVRIEKTVPTYANRRTGGKPSAVDEMFAVSRDETEQLSKVLHEGTLKRLERVKRRRVTRIR